MHNGIYLKKGRKEEESKSSWLVFEERKPTEFGFSLG